ncbi:alpha-2-macroglobulin [Niabella soli DSM 19437]|uniref:Alpha-2-macroglobulin n=2 Tax=Niabella TaxID=379899 RepID=W0EYG0_9BACT|nr:alpha-2-macroglobulin [Niabella soli DSM 19437]
MAILFTCMKSNAQSVKNYEADWKVVMDTIEKGQNRSATAIVKKIYAKAKADRQEAQVIKALLYMNYLQESNNENSELKGISSIETEIKESSEVVTALLKSYQASIYQQYFNWNRHKFYNRTNTVNFEKTDPETWTADDFTKVISNLYLESVAPEKLLQQTRLEPYDALITKGNVRNLRPTLYDLLAFRALDYFKNPERTITQPAYKFEIDQPDAFAPAATFANSVFQTRDSLSLSFRALQLYQKLIRLHLKDKSPEALIDADISRLEFMHQQAVSPDKDALYYAGLEKIVQKYGQLPAMDQARFLMAQWQYEQSNLPGNKQNPDDKHIITATIILEKITNQRNSNEGSVNARNLLQEIREPESSFHLEKVNLPDQPFRILVTYKNTPTIFLRIIPATSELKAAVADRDGKEKYWKLFTKAAPIRSWEQALPAANDYREHRAEIKADGLPNGEYYIITSLNKDFDSSKNILALQLTYISNISYVNNKTDFFVLNRNTGQPLNNATVTIWKKDYDYKTRSYLNKKISTASTDQNGYFTFSGTTDNNNIKSGNNYLLDIMYQKERFFMDDNNYGYYYNNYSAPAQKKNTKIFFFTDKSLYRPGQTVYFKGIAVNTDPAKKNSSVLARYKTMVTLYDANHQKVADLPVTSNAFGSFSGSFHLPEGGLNGGFSIATTEGSSSFRVEEYKRPKFFVDFEKMKGTYKLNDSITVKGLAKAYAGNDLDGATVKYRVVRQARFPYPWIFRGYWWLMNREQMEIAHGTATTNADGKFIIRFDAIPDRSIDPKMEPVFDYQVYTDVTDINGEVRSGEQSVSVGYKSLLITAEIPQRIPIEATTNLHISTQNMAGTFEQATINVTLTKLKPEQRLLRKRYWEQPDQFTMTKEEYIKNFPNDIYKDEDQFASWAKTQTQLIQKATTDSTGRVEVKQAIPETGVYAIEITAKDKDGKEVKDIHYAEFYESKQKQKAYPQYLWASIPKPIEPGEKTTIEIGSTAPDVFLVQGLTKDKTQYTFSALNNTTRNFEFGATGADRGGYVVNYMFVKNNRVFTINQTIAVPWTNKELKVEYGTFRDKTLPGAEEKWSVTIRGYKGEKVAAELLASMYDASLDQFYPHQWRIPGLWPNRYNYNNWSSGSNFSITRAHTSSTLHSEYKNFDKRYDELVSQNPFIRRAILYGAVASLPLEGKAAGIQLRDNSSVNEVVVVGYGTQNKRAITGAVTSLGMAVPTLAMDAMEANTDIPSNIAAPTAIQPRKNFNETAFFLPNLTTDKDGTIRFSFTMPEALTRWKFQALAHTKELAFGYTSKEIVTQKELMVQPNAPRFLREGDKMEFSSKVVNLSSKEITGIATLQLFDAATNEPIDGWFKNVIPQQYFTIAAGQSQQVQFPIEVPYQFSKAITWRITATVPNEKANTVALSDGEENMLPVLTNRMLVTESLPLAMRGNGSKKFTFDKLLKSGQSETLTNQSLTVEYTSNPAWYAVQALPYMMEYPYECAEQTWNRYYANSLATLIANSSPKIKQVFDTWKTQDTAALLSNLQKNQELKSVLLEETPWVLQAKTEAQQKKNLALLFDLMRMSGELNRAYEKLSQLQSPNGGFVWFKGGRDDQYMTQYIITGIGHLKKLNAIEPSQIQKSNTIVNKALPYLDARIKDTYDDLIKNKIDLNGYIPSYYVIQYLYMRSFFSNNKIAANAQKAVGYFMERAAKTWVKTNKYMQGMAALALYRSGDKSTAGNILKSLKETSVNNEELGSYYKDTYRSWWWYEAPIERQSLIIEAFEEIAADHKTADDLRTWLLKNKQTNNWESTKATAEACYALLLQGTLWLTVTPDVTIDLGGLKVTSQLEKTEAGTGYMKKTIPGEKVRPSMGNVTVTVDQPSAGPKQSNTLPTWGSLYWQYFEDLDKITTAETPLKLSKKLFIETNSDRGPVLTPVAEGNPIKVGDKIKVRVELRVDRDMEYVHMKDMRASSFEPVNVLSSYKWQGGLGYYESTKDASTNFFFSYLPKGTYVFEYTLFATLAGNFSNGITTIQCMYAPEFTAHSEGVRVTVTK